MGNAAPCLRVEQLDESIQMPSPPKRSSTPLSTIRLLRKNPLVKPSPTPPIEVIKEENEGFSVKRNTDQYSSVWDYDAKLSSSFNQKLRAEFNKAEHHQKETFDTMWSQKNSHSIDSTQVESTLSTRTHSCINLSTSEKIDELIQNLNRIHSHLDDSVRRRNQQVSQETESVLAHIINETQQEQQRLLVYAKEQQTKQDEHYRTLLQKYISQLDEMKAESLTHLQDELQTSREQIMQISQLKIMTVNEQANIVKSKIVKEEQQSASMKIDAVNIQLQSLTTDETFQQLGSEIRIQTNVITNANVGAKAPGHSCGFNILQDVPTIETLEEPSSTSAYTKSTYSEVKKEHRIRGETINQLGKKVPLNPK